MKQLGSMFGIASGWQIALLIKNDQQQTHKVNKCHGGNDNKNNS